MIRLEIADITPLDQGDVALLLLHDVDNDRALPLWIPQRTAETIQHVLDGTEDEAPSIYEVIGGLLDDLPQRFDQVRITDYRQGLFTAELHGPEHCVRLRISDAIGIAVVAGLPIMCTDDVMAMASVTLAEDDLSGIEDEAPEVRMFRAFLDSVDPEDF